MGKKLTTSIAGVRDEGSEEVAKTEGRDNDRSTEKITLLLRARESGFSSGSRYVLS